VLNVFSHGLTEPRLGLQRLESGDELFLKVMKTK
jgi:hypothetical protein